MYLRFIRVISAICESSILMLRFHFSLPARSTMFNLLLLFILPPFFDSTKNWNIVWLRLLNWFIWVARIARWVWACSSRFSVSSQFLVWNMTRITYRLVREIYIYLLWILNAEIYSFNIHIHINSTVNLIFMPTRYSVTPSTNIPSCLFSLILSGVTIPGSCNRSNTCSLYIWYTDKKTCSWTPFLAFFLNLSNNLTTARGRIPCRFESIFGATSLVEDSESGPNNVNVFPDPVCMINYGNFINQIDLDRQ